MESSESKIERELYEYNESRFLGALKSMSKVFNASEVRENEEIGSESGREKES